jgi:GNAT superfamily N-acetyltransferase
VTPEALITEIGVRRELRRGDAEAIRALHERVYGAEYGLDERFWSAVASGLQVAIGRGWPQRGGAAWLLHRDGGLCGSLGLTDEGSGVGRVRWFVLAPEIRGRGLGRSLLGELLAAARAAGMHRLELETFSALTVAARLYREAGFRLVWERETDMWGPRIAYQCYRLSLR